MREFEWGKRGLGMRGRGRLGDFGVISNEFWVAWETLDGNSWVERDGIAKNFVVTSERRRKRLDGRVRSEEEK